MGQRGVRWVTSGIVDQVVVASANAAMTLTPLGLFGRSAANGLVVSVGLGYLVVGINREFVGSVLLAQVPRLEHPARVRLARHGLATAFVVGCLACVILLAVWEFWREPVRGVDLRDLIWLAPFLPAILTYDAGRYSYLAQREAACTLAIDLIGVGTQAAVVCGALAAGRLTPGLLLGGWGAGACVGLCAFLAHSRVRPWRGDPRRWLVETRRLSGWFTATALIGQFQVQMVAFLIGGRYGISVLRSAQTALLQPVQNVVTAMLALLVPRSSRLAGTGERRGLHRQTVRVAGGFAGLAVVMVLAVTALAATVLPHLGRYAEIGPLVLPTSVQAGVYLTQVPFTAAIRGMQRGRLLFGQYVAFTGCSLAGLLLGVRWAGLPGAAWGLTCGAGAGLIIMIMGYAVAAARLPAAPATQSTDASRTASTPV